MKIISTGLEYKIYDDDLKVYDSLPAYTYYIMFNKKTGFSLVRDEDIIITEKTYGVHKEKVNKVANTFEKAERNLGVILSGDKGIGKSLFAKMLAEEGVKRGYPVIKVNEYVPGIASFISEIKQEVYILFDEFDKTFRPGKMEEQGGCLDPQTEMLSLFDGMTQGKKMFIITCNEIKRLNEYLINRPGRFHYHFRFEYPGPEEIKEYLIDKKIDNKEINKVISFASKIRLNYDCLRAIAFELTYGESDFESAIKDLNIINLNEQLYIVTAYFKDGTFVKSNRTQLDMFSGDRTTSVEFSMPQPFWMDLGSASFIPDNAEFDLDKKCYKVTSKSVTWEWDMDITVAENNENYSEKEKQACREWQKKEFDYLVIKPYFDKDIHYTV